MLVLTHYEIHCPSMKSDRTFKYDFNDENKINKVNLVELCSSREIETFLVSCYPTLEDIV